jgi:hypothetical protein
MDVEEFAERREYEGYWWLPRDGAAGVPSAAALTGRLAIEEGRGELKTLGNFGHQVLSRARDRVVYSPMPTSVPRVLGLTEDGKAITLEGCNPTASSERFPGISSATYRAYVALVGAWFEEGEEVSFDEICVRTATLDAWVGVSGFQQEIRFKAPDDASVVTGIESTEVRFEPPEQIEIELGDGAKAWIDFSYSVGGVHRFATDVTLRQRAWFHFGPKQPIDLPEVFRTVGMLRNFLSLAIGRSERVLSVIGYRDDLRHEPSGARVPVELYWEIPHNAPRRAQPVDPSEMLFTLHQAERDVGALLRTWFRKHDNFEPVLNLYFGVLHHPDLYLDVRFLTYAQAIETYDFRRRDPRRRTLDQRIRAVLAECPEVSARIVGSGSDRDKFVRLFKDSRNYYTHYTPDLQRRAAKGAALFLLFTQLRAILEMSLLRELGFPAGSIDQILERCGRYGEIEHFRKVAHAAHGKGT